LSALRASYGLRGGIGTPFRRTTTILLAVVGVVGFVVGCVGLGAFWVLWGPVVVLGVAAVTAA
jgi:hypothetical protein